jgi:hypothetical protein
MPIDRFPIRCYNIITGKARGQAHKAEREVLIMNVYRYSYRDFETGQVYERYTMNEDSADYYADKWAAKGLLVDAPALVMWVEE